MFVFLSEFFEMVQEFIVMPRVSLDSKICKQLKLQKKGSPGPTPPPPPQGGTTNIFFKGTLPRGANPTPKKTKN